jgi:hypothetical protein
MRAYATWCIVFLIVLFIIVGVAYAMSRVAAK